MEYSNSVGSFPSPTAFGAFGSIVTDEPPSGDMKLPTFVLSGWPGHSQVVSDLDSTADMKTLLSRLVTWLPYSIWSIQIQVGGQSVWPPVDGNLDLSRRFCDLPDYSRLGCDEQGNKIRAIVEIHNDVRHLLSSKPI